MAACRQDPWNFALVSLITSWVCIFCHRTMLGPVTGFHLPSGTHSAKDRNSGIGDGLARSTQECRCCWVLDRLLDGVLESRPNQSTKPVNELEPDGEKFRLKSWIRKAKEAAKDLDIVFLLL